MINWANWAFHVGCDERRVPFRAVLASSLPADTLIHQGTRSDPRRALAAMAAVVVKCLPLAGPSPLPQP
jgi:hypothetical protein